MSYEPDEPGRARIAYALGFENYEAFAAALQRVRATVSSHFEALVPGPRDDGDVDVLQTMWKTDPTGEPAAGYLRDLDETVLVISHDRAFLDETVDHTLHVANGTATPYTGGYSAFVRQKAERLIAIAHPDHRAELTDEAERAGLR